MMSSQERQKVIKSQYIVLLTPIRKRYTTQRKKVILFTRFLQLLDISWLLVSLLRRQIMILVPF